MNPSRGSAEMACAAALSTHADSTAAVQEAIGRVAHDLGGPADLVMLFVSAHHAPALDDIAALVVTELRCENLLGCTGESIVGCGQEIEGHPALVVWAARLPNARVTPFHIEFEHGADGGAFVGWPSELADTWTDDSFLLLLGEPYSFPADVLLARLNDDRPGVPVLGGMASGGGPGEQRLVQGRRVLQSGAVGVLVSGAVCVRPVVSQGCRPVGKPFVITKAERNIISGLSGEPALVRLQQLFAELSPEDQQLVRTGLHVGLVINEYQGQFARGDFLVRNVVGVDPQQGAIAIGDYVRVGQTLQFHVRDANTADEDLATLLAAAKLQGVHSPAGGLLFTCNGRGTRLFDQPHHDALAVSRAWPNLPLAGFFAQGEIGPIAGRNHVHGFTASLALFEPFDGPSR